MDWSRDVYKECEEEIPQDAPIPYGKKFTLIHYFNVNLMHDVLSGKSVRQDVFILLTRHQSCGTLRSRLHQKQLLMDLNLSPEEFALSKLWTLAILSGI